MRDLGQKKTNVDQEEQRISSEMTHVCSQFVTACDKYDELRAKNQGLH
jgi:hypothetical protein